MGFQFETLGNAIIQVFEDEKPVLVTDPWLVGTAYFGSWAHDQPLSQRQIDNATSSPFVWISHGHPDHLHHESLELLSKDVQILLPSHYSPEIAEGLKEHHGFQNVRLMRFKEWIELKPGLRVQCLENENQDAVLILELGDCLLVNRNDSPDHGHSPYLRNLIQGGGYRHTYLASLCAIDADMIHYVNASGERIIGPPDERKPGAIWDLSDLCSYLDVDTFVCSSSQHIYVRKDSAWANPYRITFADIQKYWNARRTQAVEPYVTVDLDSGAITRHNPSGESAWDQVTDATADDDWDEKLSEEEWQRVEGFWRRFEMLAEHMDFVALTVGGETRFTWLRPEARSKPEKERVGVRFAVPRNSLLETIQWGYFDDLLIGNFMQTELFNMELYPHFSPIVAKLGGNAKVFNKAELRAFDRHYRDLAPTAWRKDHLERYWLYEGKPRLRRFFSSIGVLELVKRLGRQMRGLPALPGRS